MTRDTDPDLRSADAITIRIPRRYLAAIAALAMAPGGVGVWKAFSVADTVEQVDAAAGEAKATATVVAQKADVVTDASYEVFRRREVARDREVAELRVALNDLGDVVRVLQAAVARALPSGEGRRWRDRAIVPAKIRPSPKPPLPPTPAAAAASVTPNIKENLP